MNIDPARHAAVIDALARIEPDMAIGLGSGRAVFALADAIGQRWPSGVPLRAVVASPETERHATEAGIPVIDLDDAGDLDIALDGADEVDPQLGLIKGGGAALLREKLVIAAAHHVVILCEEKKRVAYLGESRRLPVEVVEFGWRTTRSRLLDLVSDATLRTDNGAAVRTPQGNLLLDTTVPRGDLHGFADALKATLGVVDHGLFLDQTDEVVVGKSDGTVETLTR